MYAIVILNVLLLGKEKAVLDHQLTLKPTTETSHHRNVICFQPVGSNYKMEIINTQS